MAIDADGGGRDLLRAETLRDARQLAGTAYTALWRDGRYTARGPVEAVKEAAGSAAEPRNIAADNGR